MTTAKIRYFIIRGTLASALPLFMLTTTHGQTELSAKREMPELKEIGEQLFELGKIRIDQKDRTLSLPGKALLTSPLEFLACTVNGQKCYESALELETSAVAFNLALLMIGLDDANGVPSEIPFDPKPPRGDPVEVWVEWDERGGHRRIRGEELLYDVVTKKTLPNVPWVYTGSFMIENGVYLPELAGVLIGFAHTPEAIIDHPSKEAATAYGNIQPNPNLGLQPDMEVLVTVKALKKDETE